jgi:hypothetical protein
MGDRIDYSDEVHQFASLVRAKLVTLETTAKNDPPSDAEQLWTQTYGTGLLEASTLEDLGARLGELLEVRGNVAAGFVIALLHRVAALEDRRTLGLTCENSSCRHSSSSRDVTGLVDETEQFILERLGRGA